MPLSGTKAGLPDEIVFKTKNMIAHEQIEWACKAGLPRGVALMDVSNGKNVSLRRRMTKLGAPYAAAIRGDACVTASGEETSAAELVTGMDGFPPPRHALHRSLRLPDLGAGSLPLSQAHGSRQIATPNNVNSPLPCSADR